MASFRVVPYSVKELRAALSNVDAIASELAASRTVTYLEGYLANLQAKTILIEDPYTDADFLDDYTAYYARCFSSYKRRCKRIHFFGHDFSEADFRNLLRGPIDEEKPKVFQRKYLGFVVARPLPQAVIGRSILRPYDSDDRRCFPTTRKYRANIFGIEFIAEGLAFQEQDTVLAACATVALWSAFHKTSQLFGTAVQTPAVITRAATESVHYGRPIPQHGLRVEEICSAIRYNGLEPEVVDLTKVKDVPLVSLLYGYLRFGLPPILIVAVPDRGWHAITLTGFSLRDTVQRSQEVPGNDKVIPMVGRRIDKFYGHDDGVGPNSRLTIRDYGETKHTKCPIRLDSSWTDPNGESFLYPVAVALPVYNKIRVTFLDVQRWVAPLHAVLVRLLPQSAKIEWDIHLTFSNDLKRQILGDSRITESARESLLTTHHPRFWWRAAMRYRGVDFFEVLFDATGIARSFPASAAVWHVDAVATQIEAVLNDPAKVPSLKNMLRFERYIEFLKESLRLRSTPGILLDSAIG